MADFGAVFATEQPTALEPSLELSVDFESEASAVPREYYYHMRAMNTNLAQRVHWRAVVAPDFTGAQSGYPVVDLADIVLIKTEIR